MPNIIIEVNSMRIVISLIYPGKINPFTYLLFFISSQSIKTITKLLIFILYICLFYLVLCFYIFPNISIFSFSLGLDWIGFRFTSIYIILFLWWYMLLIYNKYNKRERRIREKLPCIYIWYAAKTTALVLSCVIEEAKTY